MKKSKTTRTKFVKSRFGKFLLTLIFTGFFVAVYSLILLIVGDRVILNKYVGSRKTTEVPYITGMKLEDSIEMLREKKLKWHTIGYGAYVIKSEPPGGILVKEGRIVRLYLSDNPRSNTP